MAILALDLATVTGWALHEEGQALPFFGTLRLPYTPDECGPPMAKLRDFLDEKHAIWKFTEVVFEAQHIPMPKWDKVKKKWVQMLDMRTVYKLISLGSMIELWCQDNGIGDRCYQVHIATWRKHFIGEGNLKRDAAKIKCMAVCQNLGWNTVEEDAAEAMGILDYYLSIKPNYDRPWRDRMLAGGLVT